MKKIMAMMIGVGQMLGTVSMFAQEKKEEPKQEKKKGGKKGKKSEKKETPPAR
jgi:hypothetical protein